jgi:hypothetical protein
MKHYNDGKEVVAALLKTCREMYKRRKTMMKELEGAEKGKWQLFGFLKQYKNRLWQYLKHTQETQCSIML